jgi:hypothetical protein
MTTTEREHFVELLTERVHNWALLREDALETEDDDTIERIEERIREDRRQIAALRS